MRIFKAHSPPQPFQSRRLGSSLSITIRIFVSRTRESSAISHHSVAGPEETGVAGLKDAFENLGR